MTYNDLGFRPLYYNYFAILLNEELLPLINDFPNTEGANGALAYGYVDHEAGFTFELLAPARIIPEEGDATVLDGDESVRIIMRASSAGECELFNMAETAEFYDKMYVERISMIHDYYSTDEIEETRTLDFLDGCRDACYIDDVLVYIMKEGLNPEGVWVRMEKAVESLFSGVLLNEPDQDFGVHEKELINFVATQLEDGRIICVASMDDQ